MSEATTTSATTKTPSSRSFLCSRELDTLFACVSPRTQAECLYREGTFDPCGDLYDAWIRCLIGRPEPPPPVVPEEPHVWEFKRRPQWHDEEP